MGLIDNIVDSAVDAFRFKDTIFYKQNSACQRTLARISYKILV